MKKLLSVVLAVFLFSNTVFAADLKILSEDNYSDEIVPIIVEVEGEPVLAAEKAKELTAYKYMDTKEAITAENRIENEQASVKSEISDKTDESSFEGGYTYTLLFNGFSMKARKSDIEKIKQLDGVAGVYEDTAYDIPTPVEGKEALASEYAKYPYEKVGAYDMHEMDGQSGNGYRGQGMVIAVVDNEFDYGHEFFEGNVESPALTKEDVKNTQNLNATKYISADKIYRSEKVPFCFNYETNSIDTYSKTADHGTHVSGIAAGKNGKTPDGDTFNGAAPEAQILAMAVPNLSDSSIIAAIEDAVRLRADVITNSWGTTASIRYTYKEVVKKAVESGIMINFSTGNEYRYANNKENDTPTEMIDYSTTGSPSSYSEVMAVASAENKFVYIKNSFSLDTENNSVIASNLNEEYLFNKIFSDKYYEYVDCGYGTANEFTDVKGKIAFIRRGGNTFKEKIDNAYSAGATAIIMSNDSNDFPFVINKELFSQTDIAIVTIGKAQGEILAGAENKVIKASGELINKTYDIDKTSMSEFSSWGCPSTLELKPDITAIGGKMYSSVNDGKYDEKSGTSMAAPLYSGSMLLLKQYFKENYDKEYFLSPEFLNALVMTSADILYTDNGIPYSPRKQGAGLLNLDNALNTPILLTGADGKAKISLYDKLYDDFTIRFNVENFSDRDVTYNDVSMCLMTDDYSEGSDGVNYVASSQMLDFTNDLPESITVKAHDKKSITVNVHINDKEKIEKLKTVFTNGFFLEGYIILNGEKIPTASIPYMGFYSDWRSQPLFDAPIYSGYSKLSHTYLSSETNYDVISGEKLEKSKAITLGKNLAVNDSTLYPSDEYDSESFAAISPNDDGMADGLKINYSFFRNAKNLRFYISDEEGTAMLADGGRRTYKFKEDYASINGVFFEDFKEGDYSIYIAASLDYPEATDETVAMKFYIDRTKPEITDAVISGSSMILSVKDNRNIMYAKASATLTNGEEVSKMLPIKGNSESKFTMDISDAVIDSIKVEVSDYAMNITEVGFEEIMRSEEEFLGDADMDGILTADDAAMILKVAHDDEYKPPVAEYFDDFRYLLDINKDKAVTEEDAVIVLNKALDPNYKAEIKTLSVVENK